MSAAPVSVVVVSRERPALLRRTLVGLSQQGHPNFEIVVVADAAGLAGLARLPDWIAAQLKRVAFEPPNIAEARNAGLAVAAGEVVAFIDDDAVPEPTWLERLAAPFADPAVIQSGGFVLGRNGITLQWGARLVRGDGAARPIAVAQAGPVRPPDGWAVKTEGTNMAVRRSVFETVGGFDPAFAFYHDETDLNLRLRSLGATVLDPRALVHHGFAPSRRRTADRAPRRLREIGASSRALALRHAPGADMEAVWRALEAEQRARLLRHMVRGSLTPGDVGALLRDLAAGWADGAGTAPPPKVGPPRSPFHRFTTQRSNAPAVFLSGWRHQQARLLREAATALRSGRLATVLVLDLTPRRHRVWFTESGIWMQAGGLFGRSDRDQPAPRPATLKARAAAEARRVARDRR